MGGGEVGVAVLGYQTPPPSTDSSFWPPPPSTPLQSRRYYFLSEEPEDDVGPQQRCLELEQQVGPKA